MTQLNRPAPIVLDLNVEEVVDGEWSRDPSLLPALSSKGDSPVPEHGGFREAYKQTYEDYVYRFTETVNRIAKDRRLGQEVRVVAGDVLRSWWEPPFSSSDDALFEEALEQTPLPNRDEIEKF
ncbi:hypothetical protein VUN82_21525 [Micrococcaceae bacterium Sec5.1]